MKKISDVFSKLSISSTWLIILLTLYFGFVLNLAFWKYAYQHIEITNFSVAVFSISLFFFILVPLFLFFNLIIVPYLAKPLAILFLLISAATNYFMFRYGILIDSDMVRNAFETNSREAFDLMTAGAFGWILITGIIPAALIAMTKIRYAGFKKELAKRVLNIFGGILIIGVFAATSYKEYASFGRNNKQVRKMLNTINYTYSTFRYFQKSLAPKKTFQVLDANAAFTPYEDPAVTVLIMVVGETARAKNFSLYGYEKETNPLLVKQDVISFNNTTSCGTATAVSVPCMFSNQSRKTFEVADAPYEENLLDVLKTGGYDILWLENDDGCKGVCARVPTENMVQKNNPEFCDGTYCHDEAWLEGLDERLKNVKKDTVIVLHTMGSHGPTYYKRYPDAFKKFTPTCDTADIQNCSQEAIVNTYDNTILYTDFIVSSAIDALKKFPHYEAGLLYVSDHGESLGENNIYLHGLPFQFAPAEQTQVPMILWMSETMKKYDHVDYDCLRRESQNKAYTHDNLFHSLLGLLEIKTKLYDHEYDLFKNCRTKELPF